MVPIAAKAAAVRTAAEGDAATATAAVISGPKMKNSSCSQASSA